MFTPAGRCRFYLILTLAILVAAPILPLRADQSAPPAPPRADVLEISSWLDGKVSALARVDHYVYAGVGTSLVILDWADPAHPVRLGGMSLAGRVIDIQVVGAVAYLVMETQGLVTVDVGDPAQPKLLGTFMPEAEGTSVRVVVVGTYAYLLHQGAVLILDIAVPSRPVYRATLFADRYTSAGVTPPSVRDIAGGAGYLYLVWSHPDPADPGFEVVSLADPAAPTSVGQCCDAWIFYDLFVERLVVAGTKAYVLDNNGVHIIDLTTLTAPRPTGLALISQPDAMAVVNDRAYVMYSSADGRSQYIAIVDSAGEQLATYAIPEQDIFADDLVVAEGSLYLIGVHGVEQLRIATPDKLTPVGRFDTLNLLWDVAVVGRYAYSVGDRGFAVLDLAVPEAPQLIAATSIITGYTLSIYAGHAYIRQDSELQIVDITDPRNPVNVGAYAIAGASWPIGFREHYAYMGSYTEDVEIVDIAAPAALRKVGVYKPDGYPVDIQVVGQYGYVAWTKAFGGGGFTILDLSDPVVPRVVGTFTDPNLYNTPALAVVGSYVYLVAAGAGPLAPMAMQVINIADPARPREVGHVGLPNEVGGYIDLLVQEDYAYVSTPSGLFLVDVIDPAHPALVGVNQEIRGNARLAAGQGVVYTASGTLRAFRNRLQGVRGRVVDVHDMVIGGVTVSSAGGRGAMTDARGWYALHDLSRGSYTLTPARPGYVFLPPQIEVAIPTDALPEHRFTMFRAPVSLTLTPDVSATLRYTDTQGLVTKWEFPSTAVTATTTIVVEPQLPVAGPATVVAGHAWALRASRGGAPLPDFRFAAPVKVTVTFNDRDVWVVTDERRLWLGEQMASGWQDAAQSCVPASSYDRDLTGRTLAVAICRTGRFALLGPTRQVYLPMVSR